MSSISKNVAPYLTYISLYLNKHFILQIIQKLAAADGAKLDILDFLTYIPLFVKAHDNVLIAPLDDSRTMEF